MKELEGVVTQVVDYSRQDTNNKSAELSLTTTRDAINDALKSLDELASRLDAQSEIARATSLTMYNSGFWWIVASALGGVAFSIFVSALITRSVTGPVTLIRDLAQAMAAGDLSRRVGLTQRDEVGELALATDALADSLSRIVSE